MINDNITNMIQAITENIYLTKRLLTPEWFWLRMTMIL